MSHHPQHPGPPPAPHGNGRRTPEGAVRFVRYWLPVMGTIALVVAVALLVGLLTGAWAGESKNVARWIGVVAFGGVGIFAWVTRGLAMRQIRSGAYPPPNRR
ncbi:hypothetical protein [Cellulosimicrobium sp. Marseille-Q4280]|uniref:hypothetical protein n=1 Tax=Cellulosimicrobium sp. Marseille-Q4280 TaxID=2937992 RepID=UPI002040923E|nr:hypothetical protein [Cellulosimicrobium sp. Marseille-Q4280]